MGDASSTDRVDRIGVEHLTWQEMAEALWLAAVIHPAATQDDPPSETPRTEPEPPVTTTTSDSDVPVDEDRESDAHRDDAGEQRPEATELPGQQATEPVSPERGPALGLVTGELTGAVSGTGWSLPDRLDIVRALKPLKRRVTSRQNVVIDEVATAERAMEDELWWPVTKQRREPWLDLTVVLDACPSMTLWRPKTDAFVELLEQLGAFRTVRLRRLDTSRSAGGVALPPMLRGVRGETGLRDPAEVVDHSGRHVVLVITDGIGAAWREDLVSPILAQWGQAMVVSVVHLLPQWMWARGGLAPQRARLVAPSDLRPNRLWSVELPDAWAEPEPEHALPHGAVPVPVLELGPRWLSWWARLLTGGHRAPATAAVLLTTDKPNPRVSTFGNPGERTSQQRVTEFRSVASPAAQRLAQLLAAVPVDLSIAKLVQENFLSNAAGPEVVSEIIAAGLLRYRSPTAHSGSTVDIGMLDIAESDRATLLEGARRSETARVVRKAAHHHGHRIHALALLRDAIADPDNTPEPTAMADKALQRVVMRALSGPYLSRAARLDDRLRAESSSGESVVDTADPHATPESSSMPNAAESADPQNMSPAISTPTAMDQTAVEPLYFEPAAVVTSARHATLGVGPSSRQPGDSPPIWGGVPPRNPNFTGREDLIDQLRQQLLTGGATAVLPAALHGMGGIGKTQMAVEYIYRNLDNYDLVWWIQAAQLTQIRAGLTELARHLSLPGSSETHTAVPAVLEALRRGNPVRRWLLVFDAAESPEEVRKFFPSNGPGEVLVTSRNPAWAGVARPLEITVFRRAESTELLRRRGPDIRDEDADQIAEKLGDLPLAIEQAAAWRAETGMPVSEYLRLFDEKVAEILATSTSPDYEVPVAAAWNVSFDELRNRNPAAHQILHICAYFSPEPISRDLFSGVRIGSISPELDVTLRDPIQLARAIRDINRYGLAKIDHRNNTLQLHRLVQLVLRNRVAEPKLQADMRHGAHQLLANLDPSDPEAPRNWQRYRELLPHAYAANVVDCTDNWVRQLAINLMRFLFRWGDHDEAVNLARDALKDFTTKLGPNDPQTLEVALRLGQYLWSLGRFAEAAELNQTTLERRIQVSGENSEETLAVQSNILADLKAKGDFAGTRQLSEEILLKTRRLLDDDDPETLAAAFLHGISLRLTGDFAAARKLDEDTHRRRVEVLGHDHLLTVGTAVSIAVDRREAGEYAWARAEFERLTELAIEQFGIDRMATQVRIYLLSIARRKAGDHPGALELSGPVLAHFRNRYGLDHPTTVSCLLAHSIDLRHAGELADARRLGEEAFEANRRLLGERHPHTLAVTVDLAVTLRLAGDAAAARALDQRAFEQLRTNLGANHPNAIVSGVNLASDLAALGESDAAIELGTEMVSRASESLGPDHPTTLAAEVNLIFDQRVAGREDTEAQFSDVMARYRRTLGDDHLATILASRGSRANCDIDPLLL